MSTIGAVCRSCESEKLSVFLDLGLVPIVNNFSVTNSISEKFPLKILICESCWLAQTEDILSSKQIFNYDYPYFSSQSSGFLEHAKNYSKYIISKLDLSSDAFVVEIASNDGYLLKNFIDFGIPCLGIEPTESTALAAQERNIPTVNKFFDKELATQLVKEFGKADLIVANNVLAHVPNINNFIYGLSCLLKDNGTITIEFPDLQNFMLGVLFDSAYHEHFSYLSLTSLTPVLNRHGLAIYDVEKITTHGGGYRIFLSKTGEKKITQNVEKILISEKDSRLNSIEIYQEFQSKVDAIAARFKFMVGEIRNRGLKVSGYGAAAKTVILLNYCSMQAGYIDNIFDSTPAKIGKLLPGTYIQITDEILIPKFHENIFIVFPWNHYTEMEKKLLNYRIPAQNIIDWRNFDFQQ